MENRIHYLDTVKGIAIVLMVIGHAIAKCLKGTSAVISVVVPEAPINILVASGIGNIIYTFHMGLFSSYQVIY